MQTGLSRQCRGGKMVTLTIDNKEVQVPDDSTILAAAEKLSIHIPTLCYAKTLKPSASCMVCVVRVEGLKSLVPACGSKAIDKMIVTTNSNEIHAARTAAIELLLSDHLGDCLGPCMVACPAKMNIPLMIRQIAAGDLTAAIATIKKDIPLPAILGRICPAPCEKVCRRAQSDSAVSICLLKRFVADADLASPNPYRPQCADPTGKKVAVIGAGACGLSAAYYLKQQGIDCVIYDRHENPGGKLRYGETDRSVLPIDVVDREIEQLLSLGIQFKGNIEVPAGVSIEELKSQYDAVLIAMGSLKSNDPTLLGIEIVDGKIQIDRRDYATSKKDVFAAGPCTGSRDLCIRAVADGKEAAFSILSYLLVLDAAVPRRYNHRLGRLENEEIELFSKLASAGGRIEPKSPQAGLTGSQVQSEAARCLHCDCRKSDDCQLRNLATEFDARQKTWAGQKKRFRQITDHKQIIFEPGKCIKCGLCVQVAQKAGETIGLAFQGRGFGMDIAVPLEKTFAEGLTAAWQQCVEVCPTGALASR